MRVTLKVNFCIVPMSMSNLLRTPNTIVGSSDSVTMISSLIWSTMGKWNVCTAAELDLLIFRYSSPAVAIGILP